MKPREIWTRRSLASMWLKHPDADVDQLPEDVGIIVEGVQVLSGINDVATAFALLFGIIFGLNLSDPTDLKYTFEFIQKIVMELDTHRLSTKIHVLKNKLLEWMHEAVTVLWPGGYSLHWNGFVILTTWAIVLTVCSHFL